MDDREARGLGGLLIASGWTKTVNDMEHGYRPVAVKGNSQCGKTAAAEFQRELTDKLMDWASSYREATGREPGEHDLIVTIGGERICLRSLHVRLEAAGIVATIYDQGIILEPTPLRADELLASICPEVGHDLAAATRDYLRHDPTKNTKRRMRRAKGRK